MRFLPSFATISGTQQSLFGRSECFRMIARQVVCVTQLPQIQGSEHPDTLAIANPKSLLQKVDAFVEASR